MSQSDSDESNSSKQSILFFYSKSSDKPPGKGTNESLNPSDDFSKLSRIKNWRKILSNFHVGTFSYKNKTYRTVEHCFHAEKISLASPAKAHQFSLESKSTLSKGDGEAARKARKIVMLNDQQVREWNRKKFSLLEEMLYCKFSQNDEGKRVLMETNNAELWHGTRGQPKQRQIGLERVRSRIREENQENQDESAHSEDDETNHEEEKQELKRKRVNSEESRKKKKK